MHARAHAVLACLLLCGTPVPPGPAELTTETFSGTRWAYTWNDGLWVGWVEFHPDGTYAAWGESRWAGSDCWYIGVWYARGDTLTLCEKGCYRPGSAGLTLIDRECAGGWPRYDFVFPSLARYPHLVGRCNDRVGVVLAGRTATADR